MVYTKVSTGGATSSSVAADIGRGRAVCGMLYEETKRRLIGRLLNWWLGRKRGRLLE